MSSVYHNVLKERKPPVVDEIIPARTAGAFTLKKGQFLRVIDVMGKQVSDTTYYNLHNLKEKSCPGATEAALRTPGRVSQGIDFYAGKLTVGNKILSTLFNPMLTLVYETPAPGGTHHLGQGRMCSRWWFEKVAGEKGRNGCLELMAKALKDGDFDVKMEEIPDPITFFMRIEINPETHAWEIREPWTRPGDLVELRAEMDLVAVLTACPWNPGTCNALNSKPIRVQICDEPDPNMILGL